jgi:hypothetical protein
MSNSDPLLRLLQDTDAASAPPASDDLIAKVHRRQQTRATRSRRLKLGVAVLGVASATAALLLIQQPGPEGANLTTPLVAQDSPALPTPAQPDAAKLLREAETLNAEADALEKLLAAHERQQRLAELAAEHDRLLIAASAPDPEEAALERTAAKAICQADFLLETLDDRVAALHAYRNVAEQFPDTHWAMLAQENVNRLEMN